MAGKTDQLRAQLGNSIAMKAFKDKTLPFPDGAIIAAIHWTRVASGDNDKVLGGPFPGAKSFVIGSTVNWPATGSVDTTFSLRPPISHN